MQMWVLLSILLLPLLLLPILLLLGAFLYLGGKQRIVLQGQALQLLP
jgi:hypothetical protein